MDICEQYNAKVLFFVDIAEAWSHGEQKIADVIKHIIARGHDVGVHIHPDHMADRNRPFLWQYSIKEQYDIINKCTNFYRNVTGKSPVAFRAGKYGANRDTLDILNELGYKYDFSQFYGQKWCGINPPVALFLPQRYKKIIEFPVTIFRSLKLGPIIRYDKIDAEMCKKEYRHIMNRIGRLEKDVVVSLFYHSFSMLNWRDMPDKPQYSKKEEEKFTKALEYIYDSELFEFTDLSGIEQSYNFMSKFEKESINDIPATKGLIRNLYFTFLRAYGIRKFNNKAKWLVYICWIILFLLFLFLILVIYY